MNMLRILAASVVAIVAFYSVSQMNTRRVGRRLSRMMTRGARRFARIELGDFISTRQMARAGRRMVRQFAR